MSRMARPDLSSPPPASPPPAGAGAATAGAGRAPGARRSAGGGGAVGAGAAASNGGAAGEAAGAVVASGESDGRAHIARQCTEKAYESARSTGAEALSVRTLRPGGGPLHRLPEGRRIDGRVAVELRLDLGEAHAQLFAAHQASRQHLPHVREVLVVAALDLGEGLSGEVVVVTGEPAFPAGAEAALAPARELGDEVTWRRELDVHLQPLFEGRDGPQQAVGLGFELDVEVDGAGAAAEQQGGGAAGEVEPRLAERLRAERAHEPERPLAVYRLAHSSARSQLTRRRIKAL